MILDPRPLDQRSLQEQLDFWKMAHGIVYQELRDSWQEIADLYRENIQFRRNSPDPLTRIITLGALYP